MGTDTEAATGPGKPGRPKRTQLDFVNAANGLAEADESDRAIGFQTRLFTQTSLPYRDPGNIPVWVRRNGKAILYVQPGVTERDGKSQTIGYPFGSTPRLLITWMCSEVIRTKEHVLVLGDSLSSFMRTMGIKPSSGKNGTRGKFRDQVERLFASSVSVRWEGDPNRDSGGRINIAHTWDLWWEHSEPHQPTLMPSTVRLSKDFYDQIIEHPIPVDLGALRVLTGAPMRLDIYTWLTWRMFSLERDLPMKWDTLKLHFGSNLADTKQGSHQFKQDFTKHLGMVKQVYKEANVEVTDSGLLLKPSPPHVPTRAARILMGSKKPTLSPRKAI